MRKITQKVGNFHVCRLDIGSRYVYRNVAGNYSGTRYGKGLAT